MIPWRDFPADLVFLFTCIHLAQPNVFILFFYFLDIPLLISFAALDYHTYHFSVSGSSGSLGDRGHFYILSASTLIDWAPLALCSADSGHGYSGSWAGRACLEFKE